jgi:uncharacterized protein (DUF305 family)
MNIKQTIFASATALYAVALSLPTFAQSAATADLPAVCTTVAAHNMGGGMGSMMGGMDQAHQDLMADMDEMNAKMMQGGMAPDIDVAFVCSMIAHHQGAISMAEAELAHGDEQWAKDTAQKIIDAQEQEITEMLAWLAEQPVQ